VRYNTKVVKGQNVSFFGNVAVAKISENGCKVALEVVTNTLLVKCDLDKNT
jgi:hypothetical protein